MDLQDQLKKLFPEHITDEAPEDAAAEGAVSFWMQEEPLLCKYEKRKGKPITLVEGYTGAKEDFKQLEKVLKTHLSVGGSVKDDRIILQGDYRDKIMELLKEMGFKVKRVGG
ncbi:MAG TPA: translation initiation factor [Flavobacteriaceae bacterium]|nr:translation initiation factor [Flavobacteriaceae bacterium]